MATTERVKLKISGMTCAHCEQTVRNALEQVPGVQTVEMVSYRQQQAVVLAEPGLAAAAVEQALDEVGFHGDVVPMEAA